MTTPPSWNGLKSWLMIVLTLASVPLMAVAAHTSAEAYGSAGAEGSASTEPAQPEPAPAREPRRALALRAEPSSLVLRPGEGALVRATVENRGERAEDVRLAGEAEGAPLAVERARPSRLHLEPGEAASVSLRVRAEPHAGAGWHVLHLRAASLDEGLSALAFVRVEVDAPRPPPPMPEIVEPALPAGFPFEPLPLPRPISLCELEARLPAPSEPIVLHDGEVRWLPRPASPCAPPPCASWMDGQDVLLRLLLRGRVVDGRLVVDLDPALLASLGPAPAVAAEA